MHRPLALCCLLVLAGCDDLPPRLALADAFVTAGADRGGPDAVVAIDGTASPDTAGLDRGPVADLAVDARVVDAGGDVGAPDVGEDEGVPVDLGGDFGMRDLDLPDLELPDLDVPDLEPPDLELPDLELPDLELPDLDVPDLELPDLDPPDVFVPPPREVCNGIDDDRNGIVDDAPICGGVIAGRCRVFLGIRDNRILDLAPSDDWAGCPDADTDGVNLIDRIGCVGTRRDGLFRRLGLPQGDDFNGDDHFSIALLCDAASPVGVWTQRHCRVYLGQGDNGMGRGPASDRWGPCPAAIGSANDLQCISSGGDGRFHPMRLLGNVGSDDSFAVAFRCADPADADRSAEMTASAAVAFGWVNRNGFGGVDGSRDWIAGCPGPEGTGSISGGDFGCATSSFDGRFHAFPISEDIGDDDAFGIALLPHPDAPPPP